MCSYRYVLDFNLKYKVEVGDLCVVNTWYGAHIEIKVLHYIKNLIKLSIFFCCKICNCSLINEVYILW